LYTAQQRHHEQALVLIKTRKAGLAKAQTYVRATKGVMNRRQGQLESLSAQLEDEIKDIDAHEAAGREEKKQNKKAKIHKYKYIGMEKEAELSAFLMQIHGNPCNATCADCSAPSPSFVSANLGLLLCSGCADLHESELNNPTLFAAKGIRSTIRALTGEQASSLPAPADVYLVKMIGNGIGNGIWESNLPIEVKPHPKSPKEEKQRYIVAKYLNREFLDPEPQGSGVISGAMKQDIPYLVKLLSHGLLDQQGDAGVTALARAVELDLPCATEFLLQNGVDVDSTCDLRRNSPLHIATRLSHIDCVKILLRHSADHMQKNNDKQVALDYAIANDNDVCCSLINGTSPDLAQIEWNRAAKQASGKKLTYSVADAEKSGDSAQKIVNAVDEWQLQEIEVTTDYSYKGADTGYGDGGLSAESIYEPVYMNMRTMAIAFSPPPDGANDAPPPTVSRTSKPSAPPSKTPSSSSLGRPLPAAPVPARARSSVDADGGGDTADGDDVPPPIVRPPSRDQRVAVQAASPSPAPESVPTASPPAAAAPAPRPAARPRPVPRAKPEPAPTPAPEPTPEPSPSPPPAVDRRPPPESFKGPPKGMAPPMPAESFKGPPRGMTPPKPQESIKGPPRGMTPPKPQESIRARPTPLTRTNSNAAAVVDVVAANANPTSPVPRPAAKPKPSIRIANTSSGGNPPVPAKPDYSDA
jgi:hypothetical protein